MIILDTNVISEPLKRDANPDVVAWLDRQAHESLYLTTVSLAELLYGAALLLDGKRKQGLGEALSDIVARVFEDRILPFDGRAAEHYARIAIRARTAGKEIGMADGQIAAIAASFGFSVATRDTTPFEAAGISVINPWKLPE